METATSNRLLPPDNLFERYLRRGEIAWDARATRAQGSDIGTSGGYAAAPTFDGRITTARGAYGGVRRWAEKVVTPTGTIYSRPTNDDIANLAVIAGQSTTLANGPDLVFGVRNIGAFSYNSGVVKVSLQMVQDVTSDFEPWLARQLGRRIARAESLHFISGNGVGQPQGVLTGASVGRTAASSTAVTYTDLVELLHSVNAGYRMADEQGPGDITSAPSVGWLMNDATMRVLEELLDAGGRPVLEPPAEPGAPWTVLGYPVSVDDNMPSIASGAKPICFGNFSEGYLIRDVAGFEVKRLTETFANAGQVGFIAFARCDGVVQNPAAIKTLVMP